MITGGVLLATVVIDAITGSERRRRRACRKPRGGPGRPSAGALWLFAPARRSRMLTGSRAPLGVRFVPGAFSGAGHAGAFYGGTSERVMYDALPRGDRASGYDSTPPGNSSISSTARRGTGAAADPHQGTARCRRLHPFEELDQLAEGSATSWVDAVSKTGSRLLSRLGRWSPPSPCAPVFESPKDKVLFDTGPRVLEVRMLADTEGLLQAERRRAACPATPRRPSPSTTSSRTATPPPCWAGPTASPRPTSS
ncbi:hypothetical protein SALBM217S_01071 [Streptomyces griseoloalbus]